MFGNTKLFGTTSMFESGNFGTTTPLGTTIKFHPRSDTDTVVSNGYPRSIDTYNQCITCMKEYEDKSLEELRLEDYEANRKGPQAGSIVNGFGAPALTSTFSFGATRAEAPFGSTFGTGGYDNTTPPGTVIKFQPHRSSEMVMRPGEVREINVRYQCISCMTEYEDKSLEELRFEDYIANRKGPQAGNTLDEFKTSTFSFGVTQRKSPFDTTFGTNTVGARTNVFGQACQQQNTHMYPKSSGFRVITTTMSNFTFGTTPNASLFGQTVEQKTGLFGAKRTDYINDRMTANVLNFDASTGNTGLFDTNQTGASFLPAGNNVPLRSSFLAAQHWQNLNRIQNNNQVSMPLQSNEEPPVLLRPRKARPMFRTSIPQTPADSSQIPLRDYRRANNGVPLSIPLFPVAGDRKIINPFYLINERRAFGDTNNKNSCDNSKNNGAFGSNTSSKDSQSGSGSDLPSCPVCLDDSKTILASNRRLMVTTCGHFHCEACIKHIMSISRKCSQCRMKLTEKLYHPIYF